MTFFLCKLWPYLAGGLIGWLLAGWFARKLKHCEAPIDRIVEKEVVKVVDNPEHLALISKLEGENSKVSSLMATISGYESSGAKVIEKEVEKIVEVDNPKLLARIKGLETDNAKISGLESQIDDLEKTISTDSSQLEESADDSELLARIEELESENAKISGLESQINDLESSKLSGSSNAEKLVDNPKHIERISLLENEISILKQGPEIDLKAARAAGITIKSESDLTAIEGIGPKINDLIQADGIKSFYALADASPATIQQTLDNAGSNFKMANPGTWPDQANLAANNRWSALKALQDVLIGGVYPDGSLSKSKSEDTDKSANSSETESKKSKKIVETVLDKDAAKVAGFKLKQRNGEDDFTVVEGIGPKINELIHAADIHTYMSLSETLVEDIQKILDDAGSNFKLAKPGTWPAQAEMAATNRWDTLKAWQDELDGGK